MKYLYLFLQILIIFAIDSDFVSVIELDYNRFAHISFEEITNQNEEAYLVYLYSPTCHYCQISKTSTLTQLERFKKVYLVNINEGYRRCNQNKESKICIFGTPTLFLIENKTVIYELVGVREIEQFFSSNPTYCRSEEALLCYNKTHQVTYGFNQRFEQKTVRSSNKRCPIFTDYCRRRQWKNTSFNLSNCLLN